MHVVKGIYENGVITLVEPAPLRDKQEVTVLIPDEGETRQSEALRFAGMLRDLTPQEMDAFDEALRRRIRFERKMQP